MDYVYFHFRTRDISETWDTAAIEDFLRSTGLFPADQFGKDYDPEKTNYIGIVTSDNWYWGIRKDPRIQAVFDGLEALLHTEIQEDW